MGQAGKILSHILSVVFPVFSLAGVGYIFGKIKKDAQLKLVTDYITYIAAPALIFNSLMDKTLPFENFYTLLAGSFFVGFAGLFLSHALSKYIAGGSPAATLTLAFMNSGNMGLPVCLFAFGKAGLASATIFFVAISILHYSAGTAIASGRGKIIDAFILPLAPAAILGIVANRTGFHLPSILDRPIGLLADSAIPLMLFSLGLRLSTVSSVSGTLPWKLGAGRFLVGLVTGGGAIFLFSLKGVPAWVILIQACMPPAVFNFILCEKFGKDADLAASTIFVGTALALFTLPLLLFFSFFPLQG